jgi:ribosomal protein L14
VAEVRTGPDRWEEISILAAAMNVRLSEGHCASPELAKGGDGIISAKRARCLLAGLLNVELPSDAVRIRGISSLGLPFVSSSSALVVALVEVEVRLDRQKDGWQVSQLRTGSRDWIDLTSVVKSINEGKRKRAQKDLETVVRALEAYRRETGSYVPSDKHAALIDHLSPRYLAPIIRLDPWRNPYRYQGQKDHFELRSDGPDGRENTGDDVVLNGSATSK